MDKLIETIVKVYKKYENELDDLLDKNITDGNFNYDSNANIKRIEYLAKIDLIHEILSHHKSLKYELKQFGVEKK